MSEQRKLEGAGLGKRLGAYMIDLIILALILGVVEMLIFAILGDRLIEKINPVASVGPLTGTSSSEIFQYNRSVYEASWRATENMEYLIHMMTMLSAGIIFCYGASLEIPGKKNKAATFGKRIMELQVECVKGKNNVDLFLDVTIRNIVKVMPLLLVAVFYEESDVVFPIAGLLSMIDTLTPLFNKDHRALHDYIAGTIVVRSDQVPAVAQQGSSPQVVPPIHIELPKPPFDTAAPAATSAPSAVNSGKTVAPAMQPKLMGIKGQYSEAELPLDVPIVMGRDSAQCNLIFENATQGVSRAHCRIKLENGRIFLTDLGSSYGTIVNGTRKLAANETVELRPGDRFTIGKNETFVVK